MQRQQLSTWVTRLTSCETCLTSMKMTRASDCTSWTLCSSGLFAQCLHTLLYRVACTSKYIITYFWIDSSDTSCLLFLKRRFLNRTTVQQLLIFLVGNSCDIMEFSVIEETVFIQILVITVRLYIIKIYNC